jgi:hypothetical protein
MKLARLLEMHAVAPPSTRMSKELELKMVRQDPFCETAALASKVVLKAPENGVTNLEGIGIVRTPSFKNDPLVVGERTATSHLHTWSQHVCGGVDHCTESVQKRFKVRHLASSLGYVGVTSGDGYQTIEQPENDLSANQERRELKEY